MKKKDKNEHNINLIAYGLQRWEIESNYATKLESILLDFIKKPWYKRIFTGSIRKQWKQEFESYLSRLETLHNGELK